MQLLPLQVNNINSQTQPVVTKFNKHNEVAPVEQVALVVEWQKSVTLKPNNKMHITDHLKLILNSIKWVVKLAVTQIATMCHLTWPLRIKLIWHTILAVHPQMPPITTTNHRLITSGNNRINNSSHNNKNNSWRLLKIYPLNTETASKINSKRIEFD